MFLEGKKIKGDRLSMLKCCLHKKMYVDTKHSKEYVHMVKSNILTWHKSMCNNLAVNLHEQFK
jgi:hypothetical protein